MSNPIIVYHGNCLDGMTALWVCRQRWPEADAYEGMHGVAPNIDLLRDRVVVMVDFVWPLEAMQEVLEVAQAVQVIDHHKTAQETLQALTGHPKLTATFSMSKSGAGLAWDTLMPDQPRPEFVSYIEDADLWAWKLEGSRQIHLALESYDLDFSLWCYLIERTEKLGIWFLRTEGYTLEHFQNKLVREVVSHAQIEGIGDYEVLSVCCPCVELVSDVGAKLAEGMPFAAAWRQGPNGSRIYSLRSAPDGIDVSEVAKLYGGGGHAHSAGFTVEAAAIQRSASKNSMVELHYNLHKCTGIAASWCPNCGDCICLGGGEDAVDRNCPLHAPGSMHAEN